MSILIVDDSLDNRLLYTKGLEGRGYVCHTDSSGGAALEVLSREPVDIALIDIMMPGMTGSSLFQHVNELHPEVAVIFLKAVDDLNIAVDHIKKGAYDYLVKPVTEG